MSDRRASTYISYERLKEALGLPDDAEIMGVVAGAEEMLMRNILVVVKHPNLPTAIEGVLPHVVRNIEELKTRIKEVENG